MGSLRIHLLGSVRIAREGEGFELRVTRAAQALLAYLLLHRHRLHTREALAGLFWGEHTEKRARSCLNTAVWRLRRQLEPGGVPRGTYLVTTPTGEVGFNRSAIHWLDVEMLEAGVKSAVSKPLQAWCRQEADRLEQALGLYAGDLLEGHYEDWALRERERLRCVYLNGLACLMRYHGHSGSHDEAIECGRRILAHDPLREEIHRDLMRLYAESGQRPLAVRQYQECRQALGETLGVEPMEETRALHAQIVGSPNLIIKSGSADADARSFSHALELLKQAIESFDKASEQLHRAVQVVERFSR